MRNTKLLVIIAGLLVLVVFIILFILISNNFPPSSSGTDVPTPTSSQSSISPNVSQGPDPEGTYQTLSPEDEKQIQQDAIVGKLLDSLPYQGKYFQLTYDYKTLQFVLNLDKTHQQEANQEFDSFLQAHNIANRAWLDRLKIQ